MRPYLEHDFGNPSSAHRSPARSPVRLSSAHGREVATLLGSEPGGIVFTASGSEADNLAIKGVALAHLGRRDHLITSADRAPGRARRLPRLELRLGSRLTIVPVDGFGLVDPDDVRRAIEPRESHYSLIATAIHTP